MGSPYDLASVSALVAFEAAARHGSFKRAAGELNVTAAAISHQVKALEVELGCALFERQARGVVLTAKGASLSNSLVRGFNIISDSIVEMRERPDAVDVTIGTTTAFSSLWLTPKIAAFWKIYPSITVSQIVNDVPVATNRCDLSIHYGDNRLGDEEVRTLFRDRIVALGTSRFAEEYKITSLADLLVVPLIHSSGRETNWTTWDDWFQALGCQSPKGRTFFVNNYMIALQAAQDDVGCVLGWDGLVSPFIADRKLIQLVPDTLPSPFSFNLKVHTHATAKARIFADWLTRQ